MLTISSYHIILEKDTNLIANILVTVMSFKHLHLIYTIKIYHEKNQIAYSNCNRHDGIQFKHKRSKC